MPNESYIISAVRQWQRELGGHSSAYEIPVGLYGFNVHTAIHRGGSPTGIEWGCSEYDFEFRWDFDEKEEPNTGEFTIYNLTDDTIRKIIPGDNLIPFGGFEAGGGWFFCSSINEVETQQKGADRAVTFHLSEGGANVNTVSSSTWYDVGATPTQALGSGGPYIACTYAAGIRASVILNDLVSQCAYPVLELSFEEDRVFAEAVVVEGPLHQKIAEFAAVCGSAAYTANGLLVVKNLGVNRAEDRLLINQHSGLIEAPTPFAEESQAPDGKSLKGYKVKMLGNQRVQIGAPVLLQSQRVNAPLTVLRGRHSFDGKNLLTEATLVEM